MMSFGDRDKYKLQVTKEKERVEIMRGRIGKTRERD